MLLCRMLLNLHDSAVPLLVPKPCSSSFAKLLCILQNARHRLAARSKPGQKACTAKTKLLEPKKRREEWVTEGKGDKQEDDNLWSTQLAKNRRSRFAKTDRDELSMEKNARNNVVFKGADCCHARRLMHYPFYDPCTVIDIPSVTPWSWQVYTTASRTHRTSVSIAFLRHKV